MEISHLAAEDAAAFSFASLWTALWRPQSLLKQPCEHGAPRTIPSVTKAKLSYFRYFMLQAKGGAD